MGHDYRLYTFCIPKNGFATKIERDSHLFQLLDRIAMAGNIDDFIKKMG